MSMKGSSAATPGLLAGEASELPMGIDSTTYRILSFCSATASCSRRPPAPAFDLRL